ncbi:hypothetical protein IIA15_01980 [candidate division TA06 bacterium]|nr:hypothetical protein [candidate division TA06 bacterium]
MKEGCWISVILLSLYNPSGQKLSTLWQGLLETGEYSFVEGLSQFPSGVHLFRIQG